MVYKLMAVDIDGTLVDSHGNLTERTREAITLGVENGLIFTISSGRPIQGVQKLNEMLNLDLPFITYNGAMVVMGKTREILYERKLTGHDARNIIGLGKKFGTTVIVWKDNQLVVEEINEKVKRYQEISKVEPVVVPDLVELAQNGVTKILWYDDIDTIERWQKEIGEFLGNSVNYHTSRPMFLEFVDKNASKAIAMEKLGEHYGINREEMIAVGDGYNDLSMIEYAGLGVAMGNANDEIKQKADYVTLSNDEDGVADVIFRFVLNKMT